MTIRRPTPNRFWEKVNKNGPMMPHMKTCCWSWTGNKVNGYGVFYDYRSDGSWGRLPAHRVAWKLATGKLPPDNREVCHHCDNPSCQRFSHLFLGTHADNMADMGKKKRNPYGRREHHNHQRGSRHWTHRHPEKVTGQDFSQHPEWVPKGNQHWTRTNPERVKRGSKSNLAKLAEEQIRQIHARAAAGATRVELAAEFRVHPITIWRILSKRTYTS